MYTEKEIHCGKDDDRQFILNLYQEFCRLMFFTAQKYCSDPLQQEEIVQESLRKLIEKVNTLRTLQPAVLTSYLVATVRNTAISYLRTQAKDKAVISLEELEEAPASQQSMDEALILQEELAPLRAIWPQLSQEDRLLLEGKYLLEYSSAELGERLGCQSASVRMKLTRARRRALKLMKKGGNGHGQPWNAEGAV